MPSRFWLPCLACLFVLVARADERSDSGTIPAVGLRASATTGWPTDVSKGYVPVTVKLESDDSRPMTVRVLGTTEDWYHKQVAQTYVELAPGGQEIVELLVPHFLREGRDGGFTVRVEVGTRDTWLRFNSSSGSLGGQILSVLAVSSERTAAGDDARRQAALAAAPVPFRYNQSSPTWTLSTVDWDALSGRWEAYTSLDAVVVDLTATPPSDLETRLAPILQWVRAGGRLVVLGRGAKDRLSEFAALEGAFEARFEVPSESDAGEGFRYGLGAIQFGGDGLDEGSWARVARMAIVRGTVQGTPESWVPSSNWRLMHQRLAIPGVGTLPLRVFMLLLLVFALLIGPVNMLVVRRSKRPAMLLLTIPLVSLATSGLVLGYGVLHQGVDVKAATYSLTWLDERTDRATTIELRSVFAGLSPGALRPAAGTVVLPTELNFESRQDYVINVDGGSRELSGGFVQVRNESSQIVLTESAGRGGVRIVKRGETLFAINELDVEIEALVVRRADKSTHGFSDGRSLAPGEERELRVTPLDPSFGPHHSSGHADTVPVPLGGYVARLDANPFVDDLGVRLNRRSQRNLLIGVLDEDEGSWR